MNIGISQCEYRELSDLRDSLCLSGDSAAGTVTELVAELVRARLDEARTTRRRQQAQQSRRRREAAP